MSQVHGNQAVIHIIGSLASLNATGDLNNFTVRWDKNNPEVTTYGFNTVQRISGVLDYSIDSSGIYNSGATCVYSQLVAEMNASTPTFFRIAPAGSISGSIVFSGCAFVSTVGITGPQNGPVAMTFTLQSGAGSLTAACIA